MNFFNFCHTCPGHPFQRGNIITLKWQFSEVNEMDMTDLFYQIWSIIPIYIYFIIYICEVSRLSIQRDFALCWGCLLLPIPYDLIEVNRHTEWHLSEFVLFWDHLFYEFFMINNILTLCLKSELVENIIKYEGLATFFREFLLWSDQYRINQNK